MADTYELVIVQGERKQLGLRYLVDGSPQSLVDWSFRGQARQREAIDADLILDLTPYMSLNADGVTLDLDIPATVTYAVGTVGNNASWDVFIWPTNTPDNAVLLIQGAVSLDRAATAR